MIADALKSPEQSRRELEEGASLAENEVEQLADPRLRRDYDFEVDYTDGRGRRFAGAFTNRILNFSDMAKVGIVRVRSFQDGLPLSAFDGFSIEHGEMLSHMTVSLIKRPDWASGEKLMALDDIDLRNTIYKEVRDHESIFHGRVPTEEAGAREGKDG
jgi:hypothetical protein